MSHTYAHSQTSDRRIERAATEQRGQRVGRPPVRRTGTRAAVIAAALAELDGTDVR